MRISDWSSDVCSSDLPLLLESFTLSGAVNGTREDLRFDQRLTALGGTLRASGRALLPPAGPQIDAALILDHPDLSVLLRELLRDSGLQIGRASCRERVCQYV